MTDQINDFEDTAALMANLDLIISIDTSVAHLAAASGRPTWVLLPYVSDWRWQPVNSRSPWHPSAELIQQPDFDDWDSVITEIIKRLCRITGEAVPLTAVKQNEPGGRQSPEKSHLDQLLAEKIHVAHRENHSADVFLDIGSTLSLLGRNNEAIEIFRHVLELEREHVAGHLNLAYSLFAAGDYLEGWEHFEWRLKRLQREQLPPWPMLDKETFGRHPAGTSVLVHCEQGFGDTVLFSRFLPLLVKAGYRVIVSCQPPMTALVASIPGIAAVIPYGEPLPVCEVQTLLLSIPGMCSITQKSLAEAGFHLAPRQQQIIRWKKKLEEKIN